MKFEIPHSTAECIRINLNFYESNSNKPPKISIKYAKRMELWENIYLVEEGYTLEMLK